MRHILRPRGEHGSAMVEAPFAIIVLLVIGLGALWIANIAVRHHQLDDAVHAGARFGSRSYYAPGGGPSRRRNAAEIEQFVKDAAQPLANTSVVVLCGPSPESMTPCSNPEVQPPGSYLEVRATSLVAVDDPVMTTGRSVNGLLSTLHLPGPFPSSLTTTQSSIAVIE